MKKIFLILSFLFLNNLFGCSPINTDNIGTPSNNPAWVNEEIAFAKHSPSNTPITITRYHYHGKTVYYISPAVADGFSQLFDLNHRLICSPEGGLTGHGDGQCNDFATQAKNKTILFKTAQ